MLAHLVTPSKWRWVHSIKPDTETLQIENSNCGNVGEDSYNASEDSDAFTTLRDCHGGRRYETKNRLASTLPTLQ